MGDPKSWRKFVVALLPHNCCYERHSDDHIKHILENVLHLSSDGATPRNKSVFTRLDMTDVKSIQDRMKEDEKVGLARKKQQAADEVKATAARAKATAEKIAIEKKRAAEVEKKSKHMSRAQREKMKADSEKRMHDLEASLVEPPSLEGILWALRHRWLISEHLRHPCVERRARTPPPRRRRPPLLAPFPKRCLPLRRRVLRT